MTRREARLDLKAHMRELDKALDDAQSQFSIRMCYVSAHADLVELTRKIINDLEAT